MTRHRVSGLATGRQTRRDTSRRPKAATSRRTPNAGSGITIMELLVVLAIIGLLAALSLPALKGIGQSNILASATRQMMDDLSLARQLAINDRTTVYLVFVPTNIWTLPLPTDSRQVAVATNLTDAAYTTYAIFAERTAGDQPGRPNFRYLRPWKSLPDGTMISPGSFAGQAPDLPGMSRHGFPYPTSGVNSNTLPFIGFDQNGSLVDFDGSGDPVRRFSDHALAVSRASIFASRDSSGKVIGLDVQERPPGNGLLNVIRINGLTGRARHEKPQIQ